MHTILYRIRRIILRSVLIFFVSSILSVILFKWLPIPITPLMVIRTMQQAFGSEPMRYRHTWVPLSSMSASLPRAVIASEDQRYLQHHGFDFDEIGNAIEERMHGKRIRGGSTISQQTAKNVFLWPTSSWVRKGFEVYFTALIEIVWGKERIMEVYLNSIEMGRGIYGAEAVAHTHFGTTAALLTKAECALIAASLPNPLRFNSGEPTRYMQKRKRQILKQMRYVKSL